MQSLPLFCVSLLIVLASSAQLTSAPTPIGLTGVAVASFTTTTAFSCIIDQNNTVLIVRSYKANATFWGVDPQGYQNLINANAAHSHASYQPPSVVFYIYTYIQICRNNDPVSQITNLNNQIYQRFYHALYVKVIHSDNPACQWQAYTYQQNCDFLKATLAALTAQNHQNLVIGVFSTARVWSRFFGNKCDQIGASYPSLWYADYDTTGHVIPGNNFNTFKPFGGWTAPSIKQTYGNVTNANLCGKTAWHVFVDRVWLPHPVSV